MSSYLDRYDPAAIWPDFEAPDHYAPYCPECRDELAEDTDTHELVCPTCIEGTRCDVTEFGGGRIHAAHRVSWDRHNQRVFCPMCLVEAQGLGLSLDFDDYPAPLTVCAWCSPPHEARGQNLGICKRCRERELGEVA